VSEIQKLRDSTLAPSLRGEHGDLSRRVTFQELKRRIRGKVESGIPSQAVQAHLEVALEGFEAMETARWAGWVAYLLEGLDGMQPSKIEDVLRDVKRDIETRLALGRW
jgi:hypothetical protein